MPNVNQRMNNEKEKIDSIFLKTLRDLIKKINDPLLLLAFGFGLIISLTAICNQELPEGVGVAILSIFLVATIYSTIEIVLETFRSSKKTNVEISLG